MTLDKKTYSDLFFNYSARLCSYVRNCCMDSCVAEDIVQDAFIKMWEAYGGKEVGVPKSLLFRIVRNKCLDHMRQSIVKKSIFKELNDDSNMEFIVQHDFDSYQQADGITIIKELNFEVSRLVDSLPPKSRDVFNLSRKEGHKNKEIAEFLGISEKSVEKHITKAIKHIRRGLSGKGF